VWKVIIENYDVDSYFYTKVACLSPNEIEAIEFKKDCFHVVCKMDSIFEGQIYIGDSLYYQWVD